MIFFVTGGSRGIGESIVLEAIKKGHDVGFTYHTSGERAAGVVRSALALRPDARCQAYSLDVRKSDDVECTGDSFLNDFGEVDVVVSNAGINRKNLLMSMSDEEWSDVIQTNLTGAFYVCRYFLTPMLARRFGRFILISSLGHAGVSGQANYGASKAGLHGLSSSIAKEYGRKGVTSNVIVPGSFDTDMTRETMLQSNKDFWVRFCPAGRMGEVREVAAAVLFLASAEASFVNGQVIPVTGGLDWAP